MSKSTSQSTASNDQTTKVKCCDSSITHKTRFPLREALDNPVIVRDAELFSHLAKFNPSMSFVHDAKLKIIEQLKEKVDNSDNKCIRTNITESDRSSKDVLQTKTDENNCLHSPTCEWQAQKEHNGPHEKCAPESLSPLLCMAPVRVRKKKDGKSFEVVKMTPVKRSARTPRKATEKVVGRWREREALFDTFPSDVEK
ncbi:hypothetical protein BWQ96_10683 [Gracilariopsis chorda]|uniref:Uncharacterized protein n=1 Tax=Gracilariopsis chorda TaxID=448386 RepID=A0A2V3IBZ8_9FLOR|nr:hypothetical protein BWQ96_10683 [Gracilariopsis chorda]|eukprot:PXF39619.1 hypothetical protein BWQ96_10683 [Gracilariopsis chorda]